MNETQKEASVVRNMLQCLGEMPTYHYLIANLHNFHIRSYAIAERNGGLEHIVLLERVSFYRKTVKGLLSSMSFEQAICYAESGVFDLPDYIKIEVATEPKIGETLYTVFAQDELFRDAYGNKILCKTRESAIDVAKHAYEVRVLNTPISFKSALAWVGKSSAGLKNSEKILASRQDELNETISKLESFLR